MPASADTTLRLSREFHAPVERVFRAFLDAKTLQRIWTSPEYPIVEMETDPRAGGGWRMTMRDEASGDLWHSEARYIEIVPNARIVWATRWLDGPMAAMPETRATLVFTGRGGHTTLDLTHEFFPDGTTRDHHGSGWSSGLDRLASLLGHETHGETMKTARHKLTVTLPSDLEILMVRDFDAPKALVFEAFTQCRHLKRWWGSRDSQIVECELDLRVGGKWRRVVKAPDGSLHPFKGEFLAVGAPDSLTETLIYDVEYARDFPATESLTLTERDGRTTATSLVRHQTKEGRDGHLNAGMEQGASETYDRLEELLDELMKGGA